MSGRTAHILEAKWRSDDIRSGEDADFSSLLLPKEILKGLMYNGFKYPSPIQLKAIPVGKIGKDLVVQAKSGTGKTLVFTVVALNMLLKGAIHPQVLILAPTREIAFQISEVIRSVSMPSLGVKCDYFIGGLKLEEDVPRIQGCNVIVGTPGRIKQLISYKILKTAGIRLFVLDEADQLLKESSFTTDIDDIFRTLPQDKQMIATSATYPDKLKRLTDKYFRDPLLIRLNKNDIGLLGMVHYYRVIPVSKLPVVAYKEKLKFLENVLLSIKFAQCLVFCNMVSRVENLCVEIKKLGFATSYISSAREQEDRLKAIELLKRFKCKILVSSDVSSRGIDAENVDLVINFDLPSQLDTYFHRVGRAGRYGSKCASITFITSDEVEAYKRMQIDGNFKSYPLPDCVPEDLISLQPEKKPRKNNEELSLDDGSESSSDSSHDIEDLNENEIVKQEKTNGFSEDIELNGHNQLSRISKNLANLSDKKLSDFEVESIESGDFHDMQNHLLDCNSNPTNSVKEDDDLSSTSESVELESDKIDSPACVNLKQPEVVEVSSSPEIVVIQDENNLKVNISNGEESCENTKLVKGKIKQENIVTLGVDNSENCQSQSGLFANNIHGLQEITDTSSHLIDQENDSKNLLEEKTIEGKSLVMNWKFNTSKIFNDPKLKELISSCITYVEDYENCNKGSDEISTAGNAKYSQSINVESNDKKFSPGALKRYRLGLSQYHCDVRKDFIVNSAEDLINEVAQGCGKESVNTAAEIEKQECLNDGENKIQNSSLDSQLKLFSTPKTEAFSTVKSVDSSSSESSNGSDKDKLTEHFNLKLASIQKVKPFANKNSTSESSSDSESSTNAAVNSDDALHMLAEEFNKVAKERVKWYNKGAANIINLTDSSSCSSSDSDTSVDSEEIDEKLEQKLNEGSEAKRSGGPKKYTEETIKILREIQSTRKCFKGIVVDSIKHTKSSTSSSSDSDTSLDDGKAKGEPKHEFNKQIQNVKNTVVNTRKSSESSSYKTTAINGLAENKIPHYSDTESDVDQYSKESTSDLQEGHQRKTWKKGKAISKPVSGCRAKTSNGPVENERAHYYSRTNSFETENDIDQYSKESGSSCQVGNPRKRKGHKKNETLPKTEPPQFDYSNTNGTSNPYFNSASERPIFYPPHSNYQMQPPYYASNPHNIQYTQQIQNYAGQGPFWDAHSNYQMQPTPYASNPYYPSYPQQIQNYANGGQFWGTQSSHNMHPTCVPNPLNHPYPSECPLKERCQMNLVSKPAGVGDAASCSIGNSNARRNSNPPSNHVQSNYQMQPSHAYNQCFVPSQHPCHLPNGACQSPACAAWYDLFYKQWQYINQSRYF